MGSKKIQYGVIGVGYLGQYHVQHLLNISHVDVVGIYDIDNKRAKEMSQKYKVKNYQNLEKLLNDAEAVSIVSPTTTHQDTALNALNHNCHIFIEKPISDQIASAHQILKKVKTTNKVAHVGHIERFNPAFDAFMKTKHEPLFVECHRLTQINSRSMDISVVLDLMIHDIDLLLHMIDAPIKEIIADGISVISNSIDLANIKLIFENGCVANLTASRVSNKDMRKIRVFEHNCYTSIDLLNKDLIQYTASPDADSKNLQFQNTTIKIKKYDALTRELTHFCDSIIDNDSNMQNIEKAIRALEVAEKINMIIKNKI
tara:strand:- start:931 stop:1875 length:945 start_codon:yes stop_codon:yes gene_type:complete